MRIQMDHDEMVVGIANQQIKADAYKQQRAATMQSEATMKNEIEKERMTANTDSQKVALDFQMKQSELDVKRASLK